MERHWNRRHIYRKQKYGNYEESHGVMHAGSRSWGMKRKKRSEGEAGAGFGSKQHYGHLSSTSSPTPGARGFICFHFLSLSIYTLLILSLKWDRIPYSLFHGRHCWFLYSFVCIVVFVFILSVLSHGRVWKICKTHTFQATSWLRGRCVGHGTKLPLVVIVGVGAGVCGGGGGEV